MYMMDMKLFLPLLLIVIIMLFVWLANAYYFALVENKSLRIKKKDHVMIPCIFYSEKYKGYAANVLVNTTSGEISPPIEQNDRILYPLTHDSGTFFLVGAPAWRYFGNDGHGADFIKMLGALYVFDPKIEHEYGEDIVNGEKEEFHFS